jgi:hypothetical protein
MPLAKSGSDPDFPDFSFGTSLEAIMPMREAA